MLSSFPSPNFAYVPVSTFTNEDACAEAAEFLSLASSGPGESKTIKKQSEWIRSSIPHLE
jgi:hypothetical protein